MRSSVGIVQAGLATQSQDGQWPPCQQRLAGPEGSTQRTGPQGSSPPLLLLPPSSPVSRAVYHYPPDVNYRMLADLS